jgi:hypothetical protein
VLACSLGWIEEDMVEGRGEEQAAWTYGDIKSGAAATHFEEVERLLSCRRL